MTPTRLLEIAALVWVVAVAAAGVVYLAVRPGEWLHREIEIRRAVRSWIRSAQGAHVAARITAPAARCRTCHSTGLPGGCFDCGKECPL